MDEFYTVRFESLNGFDHWFSVDGRVFLQLSDDSPGASYLQIRGYGGCPNEIVMSVRNEWDFVRYGTISYGERIVQSDPPGGFLDPAVYAGRDRFTVRYDSPNFVFINQIGAQVSGGDTPHVQWTKRLDNGPPDTVEIVLDRPLPADERTVFTFTDVDPAHPDQSTVDTVAYTFQRGDVNADGRWNLLDFAALQNCFGVNPVAPSCTAFDYNLGGEVDLTDFAAFFTNFSNGGP